MSRQLTREEAWELLQEYNKEPFHLRHGETVEGAMRYFARELGYGLVCDIEPEHEMEKVLFAVDELTGLIGAAALMRPSKSIRDMEVKSLKKKFKDKRFAAGCNRDVILSGAERLGWDLDTLLDRTLEAMKSDERND